jgi:hypothetical protein
MLKSLLKKLNINLIHQKSPAIDNQMANFGNHATQQMAQGNINNNFFSENKDIITNAEE